MRNKLIKCIVFILLLAATGKTYAQNNPYVDDRFVHYGFSLGVEALSYDFRGDPSTLAFAANVGGIIDLRLTKYLNLRFLPSISFGTPRDYYGKPVHSIPFLVPVYLKWTALREGNIRPYATVGGGMQVEFFQNKEQYRNDVIDAFVGGGFGCDIYFRWFKLCPEIRYQIGLIGGIKEKGAIVTNGDKVLQQRLSLVFNFE